MEKITQNYSALTPAYGRDYKNKKEVTEAFLSGKDFTLNHFSGASILCSVRDFAPGVVVNLRYKKLTSVSPTKVPN